MPHIRAHEQVLWLIQGDPPKIPIRHTPSPDFLYASLHFSLTQPIFHLALPKVLHTNGCCSLARPNLPPDPPLMFANKCHCLVQSDLPTVPAFTLTRGSSSLTGESQRFSYLVCSQFWVLHVSGCTMAQSEMACSQSHYLPAGAAAWISLAHPWSQFTLADAEKPSSAWFTSSPCPYTAFQLGLACTPFWLPLEPICAVDWPCLTHSQTQPTHRPTIAAAQPGLLPALALAFTCGELWSSRVSPVSLLGPLPDLDLMSASTYCSLA